jgi:hypothetical protein
VFQDYSGGSEFDVNAFLENMNNHNDQTAYYGKIDSMRIIRGESVFDLGAGEIIIFDFEAGKPSAAVYKGKGRFYYTPPDDVEKFQLEKFTGKEKIDSEFDNACLFFTTNLFDISDSSRFKKAVVDAGYWRKLNGVIDDTFDHFSFNIRNLLLQDLLRDEQSGIFLADFDAGGVGHLLFYENPGRDDYYALYRLERSWGHETYDQLGGYSINDLLPSLRNAASIDITNYKIESVIETNGKMDAECRIEFVPLKNNCRFLYFVWSEQNKIKSATDSNGDTLMTIRKTKMNDKDEYGFGVVLNKPLSKGTPDFIEVTYRSKSLKSTYGIFYLEDKGSWFPSNIVRDVYTFELSFDVPKSYEVISCGKLLNVEKKGGRKIYHWVTGEPYYYVSFEVGAYRSKEISVENLPVVKSYISKHIRHDELALGLLAAGVLSSKDMLGDVAADVTNSLSFFTNMLGSCGFDTIRVVETFSFEGGVGSPGLLHISWDQFQIDDMEGYTEALRAHEASHLWWGHNIDNEVYRDSWIIEGLAKYCGIWFYRLSTGEDKKADYMWERWRQRIIGGTGSESIGHRAGPPVMGRRLYSTKSYDYYENVYLKGAQIFHMIRYMMHDYKTNSDDKFAAFLRDIAQTYKGKIITTAGLQELLEKHTGTDMTWFFNQWVYGVDIPDYDFDYKTEPTSDGKFKVKCVIKQKKVPDDFKMIVPITIIFDESRYMHMNFWVDKPVNEIELPLLPYKPDKIIFNTYKAVLCR